MMRTKYCKAVKDMTTGETLIKRYRIDSTENLLGTVSDTFNFSPEAGIELSPQELIQISHILEELEREEF